MFFKNSLLYQESRILVKFKMSNHLPVSRIKTIMKSSADVETISKESLHLVTIATELFIKHLAKRAEKASQGKEIEYKHIAEVVNTSERYDFLTEIIPRKVTVRQFKKLLAEKKANEGTSDESDNSDSEESNSSVSSESDENNSDDDSDQNSSTQSGPDSK